MTAELSLNETIVIMDTLDVIINQLIEEKVKAQMGEYIANQMLSVTETPKFEKPLYTNKEMLELLDVDPKTLKSYRDEGLLPFTMHGSKYFYSQDDLRTFMLSGHHDAYALC